MSGHTIAWTHAFEWIDAVITCDEPEGAPCRMFCESGCESWGEGHGERYWCQDETGKPWHEGDHQPECKHEYVPIKGCSVAEWIEEVSAPECYIGPRGAPLHDGPIDVHFPGGNMEWAYIEATP